MAFLSGDETMIKAFQAGQDIHSLTASMITGQPLDQVTKDQRQSAKIINFLLILKTSIVVIVISIGFALAQAASASSCFPSLSSAFGQKFLI